MILLTLKNKIRRFITRKLKFNRPTTYPYVSGDSFRSLAQHIHDESFDVEPEMVQSGDIVFVRTNFLDDFFKNCHPYISNPYILISHNDDSALTAELVKQAGSSNIIHWFAENAVYEHPKITPIPIGLNNRYYENSQETIKAIILANKTTNSRKRIHKIFYWFNVITNIKERVPILDTLKNVSIAEGLKDKIPKTEYIKLLSNYAFIASPPGNGPDCHRTWEALYVGTIPILIRTPMSTCWQKNDLPVYIIDKWDDLKTLTGTLLQETYKNINVTSNLKALHMQYWIDKIEKYRHDYN